MKFDVMNPKIDKMAFILRKTFGDIKEDEYHKFDFYKAVELLTEDCVDIEFENYGYGDHIKLIFDKPFDELNYNITTDTRFDRCGFVLTRHSYEYNNVYQRWFLCCGCRCIMFDVTTTYETYEEDEYEV